MYKTYAVSYIHHGWLPVRLNRHADYTIRTVLHLATRGRGAVVPRREIVKAMAIPDAYFRKIATELGRTGIVEVIRGPQGGCRLVADPERLTLLEVVEGTLGEARISDCVLRPESCGRRERCAVHRVCAAATEQLRAMLAGVTFAELAREELRLSEGSRSA